MKRNRFAIYAWGVLAANLLVIVWGAFVRATGSGAGCGDHWPLCNGEVVPRDPGVETLIELTHRTTSGMALIAVLVMLVWARRAYPAGHRVRAAALASMVLIVVEALLGAGLVLFQLVADNSSMVRAYSMVAHLVNTFLLVGALTLTAWWGSGGPGVRLRGHGGLAGLLAAAVISVLLVGASGAVAALGDTLFPARSLAEGLRQDFAPDAHPLLALRVYHPLLAVGASCLLVVTAWLVYARRRGAVPPMLPLLLTALVVTQVLAGVTNVLLLAPVWLQLVHLLLADLLWITLIVLAAAALARDEARVRGVPARTTSRLVPR